LTETLLCGAYLYTTTPGYKIWTKSLLSLLSSLSH